MPREFPTALAAKISGASMRMLDTWARTGLLPPSGRQASGKGSRRSYTFQDLVSIRTIVDLRARKCPLQQIRAAVTELRKLYPELSNSQTLARLTLLTDGKRVYILTDDSQAMDVLTRQTVWAVPLGRHIMETADRVKKLPPMWSEPVTIGRQHYQVCVVGDVDGSGYSAQCREFPGTLEQGASPEEAVERVKIAVEKVQTFVALHRGTGSTGRRRASH
jgi:DNA-binding transcriptional MerR regulator/predicted RNase H-like HicB family nuclease